MKDFDEVVVCVAVCDGVMVSNTRDTVRDKLVREPVLECDAVRVAVAMTVSDSVSEDDRDDVRL